MSLTCVWNMNSPCGGDVSSKGMFGSQISVPVCASHYDEHLVLMTLNRKFDKNIEELLDLGTQERSDLLATLTNDVAGALRETAEVDTTPYEAPATE